MRIRANAPEFSSPFAQSNATANQLLWESVEALLPVGQPVDIQPVSFGRADVPGTLSIHSESSPSQIYQATLNEGIRIDRPYDTQSFAEKEAPGTSLNELSWRQQTERDDSLGYLNDSHGGRFSLSVRFCFSARIEGFAMRSDDEE